MDYILILKKAIIGIIAVLLFFALFKLSSYFIPFLIAYIISIIVESPIKFLFLKTSCLYHSNQIPLADWPYKTIL